MCRSSKAIPARVRATSVGVDRVAKRHAAFAGDLVDDPFRVYLVERESAVLTDSDPSLEVGIGIEKSGSLVFCSRQPPSE